MLNFYIYLSQAKVDMLFPQVPESFLKGAEVDLKINLGIASASVKGKGPETAMELSRRAAIVSEYIRSHHPIGNISSPREWIAGTESLTWGVVTQYASNIVFFGRKAGDKSLALLGSRESLMGETITEEANHSPYYYTLEFFNRLVKTFENQDPVISPPKLSYQEEIDIALKALSNQTTRVDYLAKVLHKDKSCVVATPLYVSLAE